MSLSRKTPLARKTPLKAKKGLTTKSSLKPSNRLKTTGSLKPTKPLKPGKGFSRSAWQDRSPQSDTADHASSRTKVSRRTGLTGIGTNAKEKHYHARVASLGCFACHHLGETTGSRLCVHHTAGRKQSKDDLITERLVICLCEEHHDPRQMNHAFLYAPSVHGNKKLFRAMVGDEYWCVLETHRQLDEQPSWVDPEQWDLYMSYDEPGKRQELAAGIRLNRTR